MDENPYKAPRAVRDRAKSSVPWAAIWSSMLWGTVGFGGGTGIIAPFVLSADLRVRVLGGMMYGGVLGAIFGLTYGWKRQRRE